MNLIQNIRDIHSHFVPSNVIFSMNAFSKRLLHFIRMRLAIIATNSHEYQAITNQELIEEWLTKNGGTRMFKIGFSITKV